MSVMYNLITWSTKHHHFLSGLHRTPFEVLMFFWYLKSYLHRSRSLCRDMVAGLRKMRNIVVHALVQKWYTFMLHALTICLLFNKGYFKYHKFETFRDYRVILLVCLRFFPLYVFDFLLMCQNIFSWPLFNGFGQDSLHYSFLNLKHLIDIIFNWSILMFKW